MDTPPLAIEINNFKEKFLFSETFDIQANDQLLKLKISYNEEIILLKLKNKRIFLK